MRSEIIVALKFQTGNSVASHSELFLSCRWRGRIIITTDLPDSDGLMLSLRDYIFPGSQRGPEAESVLAPYVIAVKTP